MKKAIRIVMAVALLSSTALVGFASPAGAAGAVQVSGVGVPAFDGSNGCNALPSEYSIALTGDLNGCIYGSNVTYTLHESGTYNEWADEIFVGSWGDVEGTFELTEHFTAKFELPSFTQIWGRCQHPIKRGSGTDGFDGVSGRLDFKDDVDAGVAHYRGHLRFG